jgi:hypothetical protein
MFALSARYCDLYPTNDQDGKFWDAGQDFLDKARKILNHEYGSSKLVTVQCLLLMAYREIGCGAMSSSWMAGGMVSFFPPASYDQYEFPLSDFSLSCLSRWYRASSSIRRFLLHLLLPYRADLLSTM